MPIAFHVRLAALLIHSGAVINICNASSIHPIPMLRFPFGLRHGRWSRFECKIRHLRSSRTCVFSAYHFRFRLRFIHFIASNIKIMFNFVANLPRKKSYLSLRSQHRTVPMGHVSIAHPFPSFSLCVFVLLVCVFSCRCFCVLPYRSCSCILCSPVRFALNN